MKVVYHKNCLDGFTAAWAAALHYDLNDEDLVPVVAGGDVPEELVAGQEEVVVVDLSFPAEQLDRLNLVHLYDHHKTAAHLADRPDCTVDQEVSGAELVWRELIDDTPPLLVQVVGDRDLWKWRLWQTEAVTEALFLVPKTLEDWSLARERVLELQTQGQVLLKKRERDVELDVRRARVVTFGDLTCLSVNSCQHVSHLGHALAKESERLGLDPAGHVWYEEASTVKHSLRSIDDLDVSEVAQEYGGGGHRNAAGWRGPFPRHYVRVDLVYHNGLLAEVRLNAAGRGAEVWKLAVPGTKGKLLPHDVKERIAATMRAKALVDGVDRFQPVYSSPPPRWLKEAIEGSPGWTPPRS